MKREEKYPIKYLSDSDWDRLNSLDKEPRDDLILNILFGTGCTVNELVNLEISKIDLKNNTISIRKDSSRNKHSRNIYVSKKLMEKIKSYIKEAPKRKYLFYSRQSPQITTKRVRQIVQDMCSKIDIDGGPQILRYTHIAHAYKKNIPVDAIINQVGLRRSRAIEIFNQLKLTDVSNAYESFDS